MTDESLKRGQELQRLIKEHADFLSSLKDIKENHRHANITIAGNKVNSVSLNLYCYPSEILEVLIQATENRLNNLKQEFKDL